MAEDDGGDDGEDRGGDGNDDYEVAGGGARKKLISSFEISSKYTPTSTPP